MKKYAKLVTSEEFFIGEEFEWEYKPSYAVSEIVINDHTQVYIINGGYCFRVDFAEEIDDIIKQTSGNQGWFIKCEFAPNMNHLEYVIAELYEKDYIGLDNSENAHLIK